MSAEKLSIYYSTHRIDCLMLIMFTIFILAIALEHHATHRHYFYFMFFLLRLLSYEKFALTSTAVWMCGSVELYKRVGLTYNAIFIRSLAYNFFQNKKEPHNDSLLPK